MVTVMDQIFNTDETGLNYKILASTTLAAEADSSWSKEVQGTYDCSTTR